ncbi:MAG: right-handed parallel beta-helix repeat-containing protein [Bacteroidia bacterium]|nr:right-handed parallel beta-helix repeat-containing protein [Bacteroidia bacterium]
MKSTSFLLLLWMTVMHLNATTWTVATNGNDNNAGTVSSPFKTIPYAIDMAQPGDIIELRGGNYPSAEIRIPKSNLTIRSYASEWAVITAPVNDENIAATFWYNEPDVSGGVLENIEIIGGYYYGIMLETNWEWGVPDNQRHGASNITIRGCKIHHTGRDCIKIKPGCANIHIISCEIYNSGAGPGAQVDFNAEGIDNVNGSGMVVKNCYFHNTATSGVYAKGGASNCLIEENLLIDLGEHGILLGFYTDAEYFDTNTNPDYYECLNSVARNNIVINTGGSGIGFFAAKDCKAYNNTVITPSTLYHSPLYFSKGDIWLSNTQTATPPCVNLTVENNIFKDSGPSDGGEEFTVRVREGALTGNNTINHNIYQSTMGTAVFDDNITWPYMTLTEWQNTMGLDAQSMEVNPMLNAQYHLQSGSPAINAGASVSGLSRDYDGNTRSGMPDIGADEYNAGAALSVPPGSGVIGTGAIPVTTALPKISENRYGFSILNNPSANGIFYFTFRVLPSDVYPVTVMDIQGKTIREINLYGQNGMIDLSAEVQGTYFLRTQEGKSFTLIR